MSDKLAEHGQVALTASFNGVQRTGDSSSQLFHSVITLKMHGMHGIENTFCNGCVSCSVHALTCVN